MLASDQGHPTSFCSFGLRGLKVDGEFLIAGFIFLLEATMLGVSFECWSLWLYGWSRFAFRLQLGARILQNLRLLFGLSFLFNIGSSSNNMVLKRKAR